MYVYDAYMGVCVCVSVLRTMHYNIIKSDICNTGLKVVHVHTQYTHRTRRLCSYNIYPLKFVRFKAQHLIQTNCITREREECNFLLKFNRHLMIKK